MPASLTWTGLQELKAALRKLPEELTGEGASLIEARGNRATATIKAGYPVVVGELRDKTTVEHTRSRFGARSVVRNASTHAGPFELGSQVDRVTAQGWSRGRMPANPIFSQTLRRERRAMWGDLKALLVRKGLLVSGDGR